VWTLPLTLRETGMAFGSLAVRGAVAFARLCEAGRESRAGGRGGRSEHEGLRERSAGSSPPAGSREERYQTPPGRCACRTEGRGGKTRGAASDPEGSPRLKAGERPAKKV